MPTLAPRATNGRRYADGPGVFTIALAASSLSAIFWGLIFMLPLPAALIVLASVAAAFVLVCVA